MTGHIRWISAISLIFCSAWPAPGHAQTCPDPLGTLDSLLVQGKRPDTIDTQHFLVERDAQSVRMNIGDPLCEGDRLATTPDTTAQLLVGPAEGSRHGLTVLPGATVVLRAVNRVELLVGRLIGAVHGNFDVVMPFARLAATGTEFEVEVTPEGCTVEQLEGTTNLTPTSGATAVLDPLKSTSCTAGAMTAVADFLAGRCEALVANSSRINATGRPTVRSANAIRQFDPAETAAVYSAARETAICGGNAKAWQTAGRVLVDWDRPQQALSAGVGAGNASTEDLVSRGRALLMRGRPAEAAELFRRAVADSGVTAASATGFGDAERDLGLVAIKANDLAGAGQHFETAGRHYLAAIEHAQKESERGVILVNLGDLALLRIRLDPDAAEARQEEAKGYYERARRHGDPPHARLGLARISLLRAQLIPQQEIDAAEGGFGEVLAANIILAMLANDQRKPHWQDARRQLAALTAEVPGFAPAEELLGEVMYESGKADDSGKKFQRAIAADPGNTSAYLGYSKTLRGDKKRMYGNAYKLVEVPAVRELASTRREILIPRTQSVKVPPAPLTANVTKLSFSQEIRQQTVTMTNRSNAPATVSAANITGSHLAAFEVVSNECVSGPIGAGAECRIAITFVAKTSGTYRATLELTFVGGMLKREVKLIGSVHAPAPEGDDVGRP